MHAINNFFDTQFNAITNTIEITEDYTNGPYFNGLASEYWLGTDGSTAKFTDNLGRRGIVFGGGDGNVVVFERFADRKDVFCYHVTDERGSAPGEHFTFEVLALLQDAITLGGDVNSNLHKAIRTRLEVYLASLEK